VWKADGETDMGEVGYGGEAGDNMMDDYQQSGNESDLDQDAASEDYVVEESDDFDVNFFLPFLMWFRALGKNSRDWVS